MIRTKKAMYEDYLKGVFGNKPRTFNGYRELRDAVQQGYTAPVSMRCKVSDMGGKAVYGVDPRWAEAAIVDQIEKYPHLKLHQEDFTFNETLPDQDLLIQGEVSYEWDGLLLRFDTTPGLRMNQAAKIFKTQTNNMAWTSLYHCLDTGSIENLNRLIDEYPDHVIEFATYSRDVGEIPNRNTVFFEVRKY